MSTVLTPAAPVALAASPAAMSSVALPSLIILASAASLVALSVLLLAVSPAESPVVLIAVWLSVPICKCLAPLCRCSTSCCVIVTFHLSRFSPFVVVLSPYVSPTVAVLAATLVPPCATNRAKNPPHPDLLHSHVGKGRSSWRSPQLVRCGCVVERREEATRRGAPRDVRALEQHDLAQRITDVIVTRARSDLEANYV